MEIINFLIGIVVVCIAVVQAEPVIVETNAGEIHGETATIPFNSEETDVSFFLGIPYALPPTGNLRFARPVKAPKFESPYIANETKSSCMHVLSPGFSLTSEALNEDCLNLNVIVPGSVSPSDPKRAVMVWIHGGGFIEGSQDFYISPGFAVFNDVVYVTLNYRLGVFGFLSTGGYDITGNYGLWDQHMALQWVHDNIDAFGGDPDKVTIFGESAGAASVMYQALYRGNNGLFKGVIAESGTVGADWAFIPSPLDTFNEIVKSTNCTRSKRGDSIACLRELDSTTLLNSVNTGTLFAPSVDREFVLKDPKTLFANTTDQAADILKHFGDLDLVIGVNSDDGALVLSFIDPYGNSTRNNLKVQFDYIVSQFDSNEAVNTAAGFQYTNWSDPEEGATQMLLDFHTDNSFTAPMIKTAQVHASSQGIGKTFVYEFDHRSSRSISPPYVKGANHAEEIEFVLGISDYVLGYDFGATVTDEEIQLSEAMMKYWTQLGKTGDVNDPNGLQQQWPEYTMANQEYIVFQTGDQLPIRTRMRDEHVHFWNQVVLAIKNSREQCVNEKNKSDDSVNSAEQLHLSTSMIFVVSLWCYALNY